MLTTSFIQRANYKTYFSFVHKQKPKSDIAAKAVREMNPQMKIIAHQNRLDPHSEAVYGYDFFSALDGVAAALDNVEASEDTYSFIKLSLQQRCIYSAYLMFKASLCSPGVYLDGRCVQHQKPLLEGGTLGSKGHTLVVVPHLTESYGPVKSSSTNAIPLCTLKNFPHRIEHTLQVGCRHIPKPS